MVRWMTLIVALLALLMSGACATKPRRGKTTLPSVTPRIELPPPEPPPPAPLPVPMEVPPTIRVETTQTSFDLMYRATVTDAVPACRTCTRVRVYYATNRALTGDYTRASRVFGPSRSDQLRYGFADVSIPPQGVHKLGKLEQPRLVKLELRWDPNLHVMLLDTSLMQREVFYRTLSRKTARSNGEVLVFIHGFNVTFANALRRTAQIAYDLQFEGVPVTYTWPSAGELTRAGYRADRSAADASVRHLQTFLLELVRKSGAARVHLIAHSMGNRVLTQALAGIAADPDVVNKKIFHEIALMAPDVDADVMARLASAVAQTSHRVTLYASSHDRALQFSKHENTAPRAGLADDILLLAGIDSVDASAVDTDLVGHFYYAENRSVLQDIFNLLRDAASPAKRFGMHRIRRGAKAYWAFDP
jgi:esterase/lipase superfamily enzyme